MFGTTQATFSSIVVSLINNVINPVIWVLSGLAIVVFMFGLVRYVYHGADQKAHKDAKQLIMWGLIALFIIFSLGAVLKLMCTTFLGNSCNTNNNNLTTGDIIPA